MLSRLLTQKLMCVSLDNNVIKLPTETGPKRCGSSGGDEVGSSDIGGRRTGKTQVTRRRGAAV